MRTSAIKKNHKVYIFKHQQTPSGGGGGGADLENNKNVTIDVSQYTEPVVVTPNSGKDGMKQTTVTLSNIPSGGEVTLYAWSSSDNHLHYFDFSSTEGITSANDFKLKHILSTSSPILTYPTTLQYFGSRPTDGYNPISNTQFKIGGGVIYDRMDQYDLHILS